MAKPHSPVLEGINLVCRDMEASLAFYQRLGLEIPESAIWRTDTGAHHVTIRMPNGADLELDSHALARVYNQGFEPGPAGGQALLGFSLPTRDAVDETYADLVSAGYAGLQPPWDAFWGARAAVVGDPDGNHVSLQSPSSEARQGPPPAI